MVNIPRNIAYVNLITSIHFSNDEKVATKLICYTRSTSSIHQLPAVFPRTSFYSPEELQQSKNCIENLICEKVQRLSNHSINYRMYMYTMHRLMICFSVSCLVFHLKQLSSHSCKHLRPLNSKPYLFW